MFFALGLSQAQLALSSNPDVNGTERQTSLSLAPSQSRVDAKENLTWTGWGCAYQQPVQLRASLTSHLAAAIPRRGKQGKQASRERFSSALRCRAVKVVVGRPAV